MKKDIGLWIDHRKAVIVTIENGVDTTREIQSNMEKHVRFSDGNRKKSHDSQGSTAEDIRDRQYGDHLEKYYDGIITLIQDADSIWAFGPGEAKVEFETRLKSQGYKGHIVEIETVDKMTDRQISAKVRAHTPK